MALNIIKRRQIVKLKLAGTSLLGISSSMQISYSTVKRVWQGYQQEGDTGLIAKYNNCGLKQPKYYGVYRFSIMLKRKYPNWGAPYIQTLLSKRYPKEKMPSIRTMQLWFKSHRLVKPKFERPISTATQVKQVHDCWQIDAKENIVLQDGSKSCYLTTIDVKSGIALEVPVFPPQAD
jgi:hypothetical protein